MEVRWRSGLSLELGPVDFGTLLGGLVFFGGMFLWRRLRRGGVFVLRTSGASSRFLVVVFGGGSCWLSEVTFSSMSVSGLYSSVSVDFSGVGKFSASAAAASSNSSSVKSNGEISSAMTFSGSAGLSAV